MSSVLGFAALPHGATYEAAKAALINLTRQMAVDFGPSGYESMPSAQAES